MAPNASISDVPAGSLPHLAIMDKLTEYPIVNSAIGYANDRYAALKSSHHLVNSTLDRAEKSLQLVVNNGVVPVLNKLEQPSKYLYLFPHLSSLFRILTFYRYPLSPLFFLSSLR